MRISSEGKIEIILALFLGITGGLALAIPQAPVGYAIVVFCLFGLIAVAYHHYEMDIPPRFRLQKTGYAIFAMVVCFLVGAAWYWTGELIAKAEIAAQSKPETRQKDLAVVQHTAYSRFQHDFSDQLSYTQPVSYGKKFGRSFVPVVFTYTAHVDLNAKTKSLSVYIPDGRISISLFDDVWVDVVKNLYKYLSPQIHNGPMPLGDTETYDFSGDVFFYMEKRMSESEARGYRLMSRDKGFSLKFRGPGDINY